MRLGFVVPAGVLVAVFAGLLVHAQDRAPAGPVFEEMTEKQERSIAKAVEWMLKTQNNDGLWGCEKATSPSTAITGLAVLALLAGGSTTSEGPNAEVIRKAIDRMLAIQNKKTGQITQFDSTGMGIFYDHSCATIALSEAYGMRREESEEDAKLRDRIDLAIQLIYNKQSRDGGFGPQGGDQSDLGVTTSVWMALRSAHNAGLTVKNANVEKIQAFVKSCAEKGGGFGSHPSQRGQRMFYPTSAGLRIMYGMGLNELPEVVKGTELLLKKAEGKPVMGADYGGQISEWDYCAAFYAVQAMMHEGGPAWRRWFPIIRDYLIQIQNADGSWTIQYCTSCRAYATALSLLVLQAPKRLLPLFQL